MYVCIPTSILTSLTKCYDRLTNFLYPLYHVLVVSLADDDAEPCQMRSESLDK